jgi:plastocyanin
MSLVCAIGLYNCGSSGKGQEPAGAMNNCSDSDFTVVNSVASSPTPLSFDNFTYSPRCLRISVGTSVAFTGDFSSHPLRPGLAPGQSGTASPNTPIQATGSGTSKTFIFNAAGDYPFYCENHHAQGMMGVVRVR